MKLTLSELSEVKGIGKKTIQRIREYKLADEGYISKYNESLHLERNSVNQGDCLELMNGISDKSIDMILADLPYGTTACSWDSIIDLDKLWERYERILKPTGVVLLTAREPFSAKLINNNITWFKYDWIWKKTDPSNFVNAHNMPIRNVEQILVFANVSIRDMTYNPQGLKKYGKVVNEYRKKLHKNSTGGDHHKREHYQEFTNYPKQILKFKNDKGKKWFPHPTQKPVKLFEYLIKTYTNKGDLVLDNVAGSGTTGVAAKNTNRDYILIEKEEEYYNVILDRLEGES